MEAERLIANGAWRIVMGTAAIENQNMVWDLCRDNPGKIVVSLDVRRNEGDRDQRLDPGQRPIPRRSLDRDVVGRRCGFAGLGSRS